MIKGIDCATKLTAITAAGIKTAGYEFAGRYLVPNEGVLAWKALTAEEARVITDAGLRLLTVWETTADRVKGGATAGREDGARAYQCAKEIGMPANGIIYFAVDYDAQPADYRTIADYLAAARTQTGEYEVGVYGSYSVVEEMAGQYVCKGFWQCLAWSYGRKSDHLTVYQGEFGLTVAGVPVDGNECPDMDTAGIWTYADTQNEPQNTEYVTATDVSDAASRLIATARAEIGYLEKATNAELDDKTANAGSNNWTKYARDLDALGNIYNGAKNGFPWCDVFVDWCFIKTFGVDLGVQLLCQAYGGLGAGCTYSAQYYKTVGQFYTQNPQPGDQIFFTSDGGATSGHTGIVSYVGDGVVYTIEGNTSSEPGVIDNGGCVREKSYPLSYAGIYGYGRPNWNLAMTYEEDEDMTLDKFKELMQEYRTELQDNDCGEWSAAARQWAIKTGMINGIEDLPDGTQNYAWADTLTREQAAMLFYRFAQMMGKA